MKLLTRSIYLVICTTLLFSGFLSGSPATAWAQEGPEETPFPEVLSPNTTYQRYLPFMLKMNNIDLSFGGYEVTQGIQTPTNTIPLVANRPTVLRLYALSNQSAVSNVRISITARRNGSTLSGSPLVVGPGTVSPSISRANLASSFNVRLPAAWLSGLVTLQVNLDSTNVVHEGNESNNQTSFNLNFGAMPALSIKAVPITFVDPDSGKTYPAPSGAYLSPGILEMYPLSNVTVSVRSGINVTCDLDSSNCWSNVLNQLTSLKSTDNAPSSQVYYGMVPMEDSAGSTWFYSGTAGIGWVSLRVSMGLADSPRWGINGGEIAAHEIGHNLGRLHAPCGGPTGVDTSFPYQNGSIGQYGLNTATLQLLPPTTYSDVMGYCNTQWISDYTYNALRAALLNTSAAATETTSSLLVRALLDGDTISEIEPAYSFTGFPSPADAISEYAIEFVDESGQMVSSYPLQVLETDEPGIHIRRINSLVPLPAQDFSAYRIVRQGVQLAESRLAAPQTTQMGEPAAVEIHGDELRLTWGAAAPALVRYSADGGQTWITLGLDVLGGRLTVPRSELPEANLHFEIIPAGQNGPPTTIDWIHQR